MSSSSLFLRTGASLISILSLLSTSAHAANYALDTEFSGSTFFNTFNFFTDADPTHGFVTYVNEPIARERGLIQFPTQDSVYIGVDFQGTYDGSAPYYGINGVGRQSVRIESQQTWTHGLFIADLSHMPGGICGTWPAFWTLGSGTWPYHGEIDIIEGANAQTMSLSSLHTGSQCTVAGDQSLFIGDLQSRDCEYDVSTGGNSAGCNIATGGGTGTDYGSGFNANGGGVIAMEWTSDHINIWNFPRGAVPSDIAAGNPDPSTWRLPDSNFEGGPSGSNYVCDIDANFQDHRIVIDNTFCGDFAGATWSQSCQASTGQTCSNFVANNPAAFKDAYWEFNYIKVYQSTEDTATTTFTTSTTTVTTTIYPGETTTTSSESTTSSSSTTTTVLISPPYLNMTSTTSTTSSTLSYDPEDTSATTWTTITSWASTYTPFTPASPQSSFLAPPKGGDGSVYRSGPDGPGGPGWGDDPAPIVTVITQTWIDVISASFVVQTATYTTVHCGCTDTPDPTIPMTVITTYPTMWTITGPVTLTVPWTNLLPTTTDEAGSWDVWTVQSDDPSSPTTESVDEWEVWTSTTTGDNGEPSLYTITGSSWKLITADPTTKPTVSTITLAWLTTPTAQATETSRVVKSWNETNPLVDPWTGGSSTVKMNMAWFVGAIFIGLFAILL